MAENRDTIEQVTLDDANPITDASKEMGNESSECDALLVQISELNDKYLRLAAELENTRRRAVLDTESAARNRAMSITEKFLPVMDAVLVAQSHSPSDEGIQAMARAVESAFSQVGVIRIESIGQPLNPMLHNAIQVVDVPPSDCPCAAKNIPNTIVGELQAGYMFGDNVLRPAMVIVCK